MKNSLRCSQCQREIADVREMHFWDNEAFCNIECFLVWQAIQAQKLRSDTTKEEEHPLGIGV